MKVLFIASRLPCPPIGGDRLKNYNLIKILSKHYDVYLVVISEEKPTKETEEFISKYCKEYKIFVKPRYRFYLNTLRSLFNGLPLQVNYYYFKDVQDCIDKISKSVDFIISTLIRTSRYAININKPKILDLADSIGQNYKKSLSNVKSYFWKMVYTFEANGLIKYEKKSAEKYNKVLFFNKEEMDFLNLPKKTFWIPHGVNEKLLDYKKINKKYQDSVAFFGKMDYQPNIDAVLWFVENVLDKLDKSLKFIIVGACPAKKIKKLTKRYNNVEVTGFVEDPYEILKSCLCIVAPMQTGGGIQNKVLETMALETINIVSSLAAKPIGAKDKEDFLVIDNPRKIANIINEIYLNPAKFEFIKTNARNFIKNNFTWTIYEQKLLEIIKEIENARSL